MSQTILNKKIPSILGIALIAIGITATTFLVKGTQVFRSNAELSSLIKNIQTSNISANEFTVTYTTDSPQIGTLSVGENPNKLDQKILDIKDVNSNSINNYQDHYISVKNLKPETTYYYSINTDEKQIPNNNKPFEVKTGPDLKSETSTNNSISGFTINPDGTIPTDGIIIVKINGAQIISGLLNKDGSYNLKLENLRTADLNSFFTLTENSQININLNSKNHNSNISLLGNQVSSIPLVTLSNNYDFSDIAIQNEFKTRQDVKFPDVKLKNNSYKNLKINPAKSKSTTPTLAPSSSMSP